MIRLRGRVAEYGELWFGEALPAAHGVDIVVHRYCAEPVPGSRVTPFLTLVSDLSESPDAIESRFGKDCRYKVRRGETRDGLEAQFLTDPQPRLEAFCGDFATFARGKSLASCDEHWLRSACRTGQLVLSAAAHGGETLVWHAHVLSAGTAGLQYSCSLYRDRENDYRALVGRANRWLHWRDMLRFREMGLARYDWGGVFEDASDPERAGINRFKQDFGGEPRRIFDCTQPVTLRGRAFVPLRDAWRRLAAHRRAAAAILAALLPLATAPPSRAQVPDCTPVAADILVVTDPAAASIRPRECSTVEQTPPDFSWPAIGTGPYRLRLTLPDGQVREHDAAHNWLNWPEALPAGIYTWTVTHAASSSLPRSFRVGNAAAAFVVPAVDPLVAHFLAKPRPRSLPGAQTLSSMAAQRAAALATVSWLVARDPAQPLPAQGGAGDGYRYDGYGMRALWSLLAFAFDTSNTALRDDARRRVLNLASWDPRGATAIDDIESLQVAWVVTLGYDWLAASWTPQERQVLLACLGTRLADLRGYVAGASGWPPGATWTPPPLWQAPRDTHRNILALPVAVMAAVLAGDLPEAEGWTRELLPFAVNALSPWSGEEGGYAQGSAYSLWDVASSLGAWHALRWASCDAAATCIDLGRKSWVRNYARFLAYFFPPTFAPDPGLFEARVQDAGTPLGLFGDGFSVPGLLELRSRVARSLSALAPTPIACWYAANLVGADETRIEMLLAPPDSCAPGTVLAPGTPNALYLPATGWVAMHSDLADPLRTSVYFKSSPRPFGAYVHQAADQNAFAINAGGERLAIESGYYDGYGTGHWQYWVKRTASKNAITFDAGQGQAAFEHEPTPYHPGNIRHGQVLQRASAADHEVVSAEAAAAYEPALARGVRTLVYLRPHFVVLYESLASSTARTWEWNIHALEAMEVIDPSSRVRINRGTQSLCIDALAGPGGAFAQTSVWPAGAAPLQGGPQWHGRFSSAAPSQTVEFIALLRVGCIPVEASAALADGAWTVTVGARTITIDAQGRATLAP